ncbi:DUF4145 domain-containing protein [Paucibacter sp. R3-3]|uniref:DUF4145 domain-containing protein n=1 Tax=Roseateles agri TaxID=3098619 RepID=A0ABU5DJU9_9BURK|nr:DUF4145 domain-containing protein [Paucibacter sp. R3-3]MDY0746573.1 DUF4145 domain-containing protein [Paucibacter sp. R3-3]
MAIFTTDCPHCGTVKAAFAPVAGRNRGNHLFNVLFTCPGCSGPLVAVVHSALNLDPVTASGDLSRGDGNCNVMMAYPSVKDVDVPDHLPDRVAKAFKEGCQIVAASPNGACAQFRRALELGLKDLAPDVDAWKLEKRIDKLAEQNRLTPAIQEWAHQLRLDGNDAVHGEEEASVADAKAMESLARYVLTYLYTLPKQVELARAAGDD